MKTVENTLDCFANSVVAVPPLARREDLSVNPVENRKLIRHIEQGGVTTLMYGGNANFYGIPLSEYRQVLDHIAAAASDDTWVIPSAGPDYGRLIDQSKILREMEFPTAMVLPLRFPATRQGIETGIRRFADSFGRPVILYVTSERYLEVAQIAALIDDGVASSIKYAVPRERASDDSFMSDLLSAVERKRVLSGLGEYPAFDHLREFDLPGFTSGLVCVAPSASTALLHALKSRSWKVAERVVNRFAQMDRLRKEIHPIRVLHDAVTLAGIADMGPILPSLSNLDAKEQAVVREAAKALLAMDAIPNSTKTGGQAAS
ncbi:MAG: dihydrodipicolinate synthase family protein [Paracoccaceae bacterium]|nr:dihydrodipicolinate synthase family protein [Paracoccaceae bacterium]